MFNNGAPRTNPGADQRDWEAGQINDAGQSTPNATPTDRQVPRLAYTGNAAIMARNKFVNDGSTNRINRFVSVAQINGPSRTILATEFFNSFKHSALTSSVTGEGVIKSHRSINPFFGLGRGYDVLNEDVISPPPPPPLFSFWYPRETEILSSASIGVDAGGLLSDQTSGLNAVGRHHGAGVDTGFGGQANFAFVDGSVNQYNVRDTLRNRLWGDAYYSLTGNNRVSPNPLP
jgi:prepilin-type processing-associated H-X9-DG protein